jgi:hypothetical protein
MDNDQAHDKMDRLPVFGQGEIVLAHSGLAYNPCDDLIFPSVITAQDYFRDPLGKYYMYYAPHNAPGGICLAHASSLHGPWIEYGKNPLIVNQWLPHHDAEHVSSPHAIFIPEESRLFLYYHGDNETTHYASSKDGVTFVYGGVAIDWNMLPGSDVTAYARVFRHTMPSTGSRYVMLFAGLKYFPGSWDLYESHGLYSAWSMDARQWHVEGKPIVSHLDIEDTAFVWSPFLFSWKAKLYVIFHKDLFDATLPGGMDTDLYCVEVDADLHPVGPLRLFCSRRVFGNENLRISDPCLLIEDETLYLFAAIGPRLNQSIGLATAACSLHDRTM